MKFDLLSKLKEKKRRKPIIKGKPTKINTSLEAQYYKELRKVVSTIVKVKISG